MSLVNSKFQRKPKRAKAPWTTIKSPGFAAQSAQLNPEHAAHGGVRAMISAHKAIRDAVYHEIAVLFKAAHPWCQTCVSIDGVRPAFARPTDDVHHSRGKTGLLYFDVRRFVAVCRPCHDWIHANPAKAVELGISEKGAWDKIE